MPSLWNTVAAVPDTLAGSTDEAFARQFDDEQGGGFRGGLGEEFAGDDQTFLTRGTLGLASLVDGSPGNVAGPGQESWDTAEQAAENGYLGSSNIQRTILLVGGVLTGGLVLKSFAEGLGTGVAGGE